MTIRALLLFLILCANVRASVWDYAVTPKKSDNFTRAEFRLWIENVSQPPLAILVIVDGWQADGRANATNIFWQSFAKKNHLGLLGIFFQCSSEGVPYHEAEAGSGDAVFLALSKLSNLSKIPDVARLPILIWGHSAGGQLGYGLACIKPERVIAFASIKGGYYNTKFNPAIRKIPAIFFEGENDTSLRRQNITQLFEDNRCAGAIWCLGIEPNAGHEVGKVNTVIIPFFESVLSQRLIHPPANAFVANIDPENSWIGIRDSYKIKPEKSSTFMEKMNSVWLPDERTGKAWQRFSQVTY